MRWRPCREGVALLPDGSIDATWSCCYPFLQHEAALCILAVPVWRGRPLYRSDPIVADGGPGFGLAQLEGGVHAFSDPDCDSGWLVTASDLARTSSDPGRFFARTVFCYGHRNVVRAARFGAISAARAVSHFGADGALSDIPQEAPQWPIRSFPAARR